MQLPTTLDTSGNSLSIIPPGLGSSRDPPPNVETLGYYHPPLRGGKPTDEFASRVFLKTVAPPHLRPGGARSAIRMDILVDYVPRACRCPIPVPEGTAENSPTFQRWVVRHRTTHPSRRDGRISAETNDRLKLTGNVAHSTLPAEHVLQDDFLRFPQ